MNPLQKYHTPSSLARLFEISDGHPVEWSESDLPDIFYHQLSASLLNDLRPDANIIQSLGLKGDVKDEPPLHTFGDLLSHPSPPLALLKLAKDFAKLADDRPDDPLPPTVATTLYLLLIAAALVRCNERITAMSNTELRSALEWLEGHPWLNESMRQLALDAKAKNGVY